MVLWRPTRPFRTNTQKRCPFHYRGLECKSRKSRNTWSNSKFGLGVENEAGQRLMEFCQKNALVIANTLFQPHKRRLYTWTSPDGQHWNQIDYILCSQRWRSSIQSAKTRPGADCGSDHGLLIAKFRFKLKKVGKTTRPLRYDQCAYNVPDKGNRKMAWVGECDSVSGIPKLVEGHLGNHSSWWQGLGLHWWKPRPQLPAISGPG